MKFSLPQVVWRLILVVLVLSAIIGTSCSRYNSCPVIESLQSQNGWVTPSESCRVECIASDADGDALAYTWLATGGTFTEQSPVTVWKAPTTPGDYIITALVTDGWGGEAMEQLTIAVVIVNDPPVIEIFQAEPSVVDQDKSATIRCVASDPDGDELEYIWTATGGEISGQGAAITWKAPSECKNYLVTVTVVDGRDGEVSEEVTIMVRKPG